MQPPAQDPVIVRPANEATPEDLQTLFGTRGQAAQCQCQRYKLNPGESFAATPVEERAHRLLLQTDAGHADSGTTSGLVAYLANEPVGWCAVEPRMAYAGLVRSGTVPWANRHEDRDDPTVWAVTCLFTRPGFRRQGISRALLRASVDYARGHGARVLEGYPISTTKVITQELHVGLDWVFAEEGFTLVSRPTTRRVVMRREF